MFDRCVVTGTGALAEGADHARRFGGVARLFGAPAFARIAAAHVVVVGVGGVGSWAAEALARSGVGRLTLVDLDHVAESNTNRQVHALGEAFGRPKVAAMAERIGAINPQAAVTTIEEFVSPANVEALLPPADAVLDCIDQPAAKAALLACCQRRRVRAICSGAGGGRLDPTRIRVDDLACVTGDPLLASVRYRLRRDYGFPRVTADGRAPRFGIAAVFSDEPVRPPAGGSAGWAARGPHGLACAGYGSVVTVTAPIGFAMAAQALAAIAGEAIETCAQAPAPAGGGG